MPANFLIGRKREEREWKVSFFLSFFWFFFLSSGKKKRSKLTGAEGGGFTRPGLGLLDDVKALGERDDTLLLDRRGLFETVLEMEKGFDFFRERGRERKRKRVSYVFVRPSSCSVHLPRAAKAKPSKALYLDSMRRRRRGNSRRSKARVSKGRVFFLFSMVR